MSLSKHNPRLTMDFLVSPKSEDQTFDRKSASISRSRLAENIVAFANADGGTIALGIRDRKFEGINHIGKEKINDFLQVSKDLCVPMVRVIPEFVDIKTEQGREDRLLFLHIEQSERVHATSSDEVFLRLGDETRKLNHDERLQLEYDKGEREYEIREIPECKLEDLDEEIIESYTKAIGYSGDVTRLLIARGLASRSPIGPIMRVAAVLLFAKQPTMFLPNAKIRFMRFDGTTMETGPRMNIVKQETVEAPLPRLIERTIQVVSQQLRDFVTLGKEGKFITVPEYPEFAWQEGIVNAVTHRAYNLYGNDIQVRMFDDRLEIESPGKLPGLVRLTNIKDVRFSRNPRIARVLNELGWVREFGEGVNRMFEEMKFFHLDEPEFSEPHFSVKVTLRNNIVMRRVRREAKLSAMVTQDEWDTLSVEQKKALELIYSRQKLYTKEFADFISKSRNSARSILESLVEKGILIRVGTSAKDPTQHYVLARED